MQSSRITTQKRVPGKRSRADLLANARCEIAEETMFDICRFNHEGRDHGKAKNE
jgi:hypothetical protein